MNRIYTVSAIVWIAIFLGTLTLLTGSLLGHHEVSASRCFSGSEGMGAFSGRDYSCELKNDMNNGVPTGDDVDCNQYARTPQACNLYATFGCSGHDAAGNCDASPDTDKARFISDVEHAPARAFYMDLMVGQRVGSYSTSPNVGLFEQYVNNPDISIRVAQESNRENSGYFFTNTGDRDFLFFPQPTPSDKSSLVLYNNKTGAVYTIIKIDCGNPLNSIALPVPSNPPQGVMYKDGCQAVSLKVWDTSFPNATIDYYLQVNGGAKHGFKYTYGIRGPRVRQPVSGYSPNFDFWHTNNVVLYAVDPDTGVQYNVANVTLDTCGSITCTNSMTTLPADMVAGEKTDFTVWVQVLGAPSGPPGAKFTSVTIQTPSGATTTIVPPPAGGVGYTGTSQLTDDANPSLSYTPPVAGNYTLSWTFGGGADLTPVTCSPSSQATYEPYFTVLGGDVSAGQGFGSGCTDDTSADIKGYNMDNGSAPPNYFGASSRQAAIATGAINQFATDNTDVMSTNVGGSTDGLNAATDNSPPSGLAFANTTNRSGTIYGGNILKNESSTFAWCVPDYVKAALSAAGVQKVSDLAPYAGVATGTYRLPAGTTLSNLSIPNDVHMTLVAEGDVYLNGNITYQPYNGLANVPQFNLILQGGNIYVNGSVGTLQGLYVAEPTASAANSGVIYTCASGLGSPSTDYHICDNSLTVYGAVASREIVPGRTYGSVAKASDSGLDYPAEQFVFTPELWLGGVSEPSTSCAADPGQTDCLYQSYTSLPPVF